MCSSDLKEPTIFKREKLEWKGVCKPNVGYSPLLSQSPFNSYENHVLDQLNAGNPAGDLVSTGLNLDRMLLTIGKEIRTLNLSGFDSIHVDLLLNFCPNINCLCVGFKDSESVVEVVANHKNTQGLEFFVVSGLEVTEEVVESLKQLPNLIGLKLANAPISHTKVKPTF